MRLQGTEDNWMPSLWFMLTDKGRILSRLDNGWQSLLTSSSIAVSRLTAGELYPCPWDCTLLYAEFTIPWPKHLLEMSSLSSSSDESAGIKVEGRRN